MNSTQRDDRPAEEETSFVFAEEFEPAPAAVGSEKPWKMLVVDDDQDVHDISDMVLRDFRFEDRPLKILNAYSGREAVRMMVEHPDTAVMLLDVVMETDNAGLEVVRQVRNVLKNEFVRIILRTGQPGQAPETSVVVEYDINDYKEKTELTARKLVTVVVSALRGYRDLQTIDDIRRGLTVAEEKLRAANTRLEELVQRRTAQLAEANALLEADVRRREQTEAELLRRNAELLELNARLQQAQEQLMQSEKMASIGQLAAGVAHEINNPIGYVFSNIGSLERYLRDLLRVLDAYGTVEAAMPGDAQAHAELQRLKRDLDLEFLREDIPLLLSQSQEGISRVRKIVQDLKEFSHVDDVKELHLADLHKGLDSTLNMVNSEIKYKADVIKEYGDIPDIECLPSQLNQVFMNLLLNAAQAMEEGRRGRITLRTGRDGDRVWVEVGDDGCGIPPDNMTRIFDPFFTTKPVGKGTGLGLSLSYGIVRLHDGDIRVSSEPGKGTTFRVWLPIQRTRRPGTAGAER